GVLGASDVVRNRQVAKISVVGLGIRSHATIAAKMFSALSGNNIPVKLIATSEIKISVLVEEKHLEQGVRCLHDAFELAHGAGVNPDIEVQSGTGAANGSLSR
ncbi:MAG TPA: ACT domain-containing protein, partial [Gammaproteobacteria bacterium]|nr:ACT domain-containing protein [Gammaproteobacteria bacterium]